VHRDSNPEWRDPGITAHFLNPAGIGDALIPGFRDCEKCKKKSRILHDIWQKNTLLPNFGGQFPALKLRVSGLDFNTNYVIMVDIVLRAQSC